MYDSEGMDCQQCREVVSADLDGQAAAGERVAADAHVAECPACRRYAAGADRVTRLARVRPAEDVPDIAASVLATLGIAEPAVVAAPAGRPELTCLPGGCCGSTAAEPSDVPRTACGCRSSCGCGCQDGAPCRCGTAVA